MSKKNCCVVLAAKELAILNSMFTLLKNQDSSACWKIRLERKPKENLRDKFLSFVQSDANNFVVNAVFSVANMSFFLLHKMTTNINNNENTLKHREWERIMERWKIDRKVCEIFHRCGCWQRTDPSDRHRRRRKVRPMTLNILSAISIFLFSVEIEFNSTNS